MRDIFLKQLVRLLRSKEIEKYLATFGIVRQEEFCGRVFLLSLMISDKVLFNRILVALGKSGLLNATPIRLQVKGIAMKGGFLLQPFLFLHAKKERTIVERLSFFKRWFLEEEPQSFFLEKKKLEYSFCLDQFFDRSLTFGELIRLRSKNSGFEKNGLLDLLQVTGLLENSGVVLTVHLNFLYRGEVSKSVLNLFDRKVKNMFG